MRVQAEVGCAPLSCLSCPPATILQLASFSYSSSWPGDSCCAEFSVLNISRWGYLVITRYVLVCALVFLTVVQLCGFANQGMCASRGTVLHWLQQDPFKHTRGTNTAQQLPMKLIRESTILKGVALRRRRARWTRRARRWCRRRWREWRQAAQW